MQLEQDQVEVMSGLRAGVTLGSPLALQIKNRDFTNWQQTMDPVQPVAVERPLLYPRPGHVDLAGGLKYGVDDLRNVSERASARETAARVAVGAVARQLLAALDVSVHSRVVAIGECEASRELPWDDDLTEASPVRCPDAAISREMTAAIDCVQAAGDSLGGAFQVAVSGLPVGIGSPMHWDQRLDGLLAQAMISIPAVKAVEIGEGLLQSKLPGSQAQDQLYLQDGQVQRPTNRAGGIEAGVSNGAPVVLTCYMKPIPSIIQPLSSFHWHQHTAGVASQERADACAVPAASIVGEAMVSWTICCLLLQQLGGDQWAQVVWRLQQLRQAINSRLACSPD
jgi:chorismate synthase